MRTVRLVEEVPGQPSDESYYLWRDGEGILWQGESAEAGCQWATANDITIHRFEPFEP